MFGGEFEIEFARSPPDESCDSMVFYRTSVKDKAPNSQSVVVAAAMGSIHRAIGQSFGKVLIDKERSFSTSTDLDKPSAISSPYKC